MSSLLEVLCSCEEDTDDQILSILLPLFLIIDKKCYEYVTIILNSPLAKRNKLLNSINKSMYIDRTFLTLILKLCVSQELFSLKTDKRDSFNAKFNENGNRTKASCNNVAPVTNLCLGRATTWSHSSQWSKKKVAVET